MILACFIDVLPIEDCSVEDNFFDIGGHSLLAAKVVGQLTSKYGLNVAVLDLYEVRAMITGNSFRAFAHLQFSAYGTAEPDDFQLSCAP